MEKLITIGRITKNQGNKGEVRVSPLTDFPERFNMLDSVYLVKEDEVINKVIEDVWFHKEFVIIKFEDIDDIEGAFEIKNYFIKINEDDLLPLDEDRYYIYQILDSNVFTETGIKIGQLKEVLPTGGTDIFVVDGEEKEFMIPASREIVTEINQKKNKIIIKPIPGLLEL